MCGKAVGRLVDIEESRVSDGWISVPGYLQARAAGPFKSIADVSFGEYARSHRVTVAVLCVIIVLLSVSGLLAFYLNRRLRISRARLDLALSVGGIGVWELDLEKDRLIWDDRMYEIFGVARGDFGGTYSSSLNYIHPDDVEKTSGELIKRWNSSDPFKTSFRINRPDGQVRHIAVYGKVVQMAKGKPQRIIGCNQDVTDQVRNEQALNSFFEQSTNLHLIAGFDGIIQRINTGWEMVLGRTSEELEGSVFLDLVHPEDRDATLHEMERLAAGESVDHFENRYRHRNGEYRTIEWSSVATAEDGLVFAAAKDVTDRKRAEQLAQAALDALTANIAILDHEGRFLAVNRMWKDFAEKNGTPPESYAVGSSYFAFKERVGDEEAREVDHFVRGLRAVLSNSKTTFSMEYSCRLDGGERWFAVHVSAFPATDDSRIVVAHMDITEQHVALEALRRREKEFRLLADTLPLAIYLISGDERICEYLNPAFTGITGYTMEDVPCADEVYRRLFPNEDYRSRQVAEWQRRIEAAKETDRPVEPLETEIVCKDGGRRIVEWGYVLIGPKTYAYARDLTEQKKARSVLEDYTRSLERFNRASTGRELRMVELKKEINSLRKQLGQDELYTIYSGR
ncbi:PAS domain-containing protein [Pontiella agarivorans]|uniref:histidine kinase n=1 Tax=Pontiella agarivorans TaxID=3038953 RepID=A0ABU5MWX6_9BACT|nr:PAS domain S-box protein [Pontiella agarivorans]MDZ8118718.1 PAS domain S-box protein [Pontiella agarivorans]